MLTQISTTKAAAPAGPYSQGIVANGMLYVAGQVPADPATGKIVGEGIGEQTERALTNLLTVAAEAGCTSEHAVRLGVFVADFARDFAGFNQVYETYFTDPRPVRTTVEVKLPGFLLEVDAIFVLPT
jgi:reactive intermediate/imine deaminase